MKKTYWFITTILVALLGFSCIGNTLAQGLPFITKWECKKGKEVPIPIVGTYKMLITDANGKVKVYETVTVVDADNPYIFKPTEDGIYTVTAGPGGIQYFRTMYQFRDFKELIEVVQFGTVEWQSMEFAFVRCERMNFAANIDNPNLSKVTSMNNMFWGCRAFNHSLAGWDVSHVTDMRQMFYNCTSFNQSLEGWDVSHVTNMSQMFYGCASFNQPLNWNVSHVTNMSQMFSSCTSFNQPLNWNVSNVTDMRQMFGNCTSFNQPLNWNVSNVIYMSDMFYGCSSFNQPLNWNVSNVTNMGGMFKGCISFNQPLNWDVSKVTDMALLFYGCTSFNQSLTGWDVSNVTDMRRMFNGCTSFNQSLGAWKIKTKVGSLGETAMSVENYSKSLVGWAEWAKQADIRDIKFNDNVEGLVYNAKGKAARAELIKRGWTFEGDIEQTFEVTLVPPDHGTLAIEGYTTEMLKKVSDETELTITATTTEEGYELKELQVNGTKLEGKKFKVTKNTTVTALFGKKTFPVTASVKDGKGGEVKIEGAPDLTAVEYGTTLTVVVTPDEANGYKLKAVTVNGTPLAEGEMTFVVKEAKTVEAEFELKTFPVTKELKGVTTGEITITGAANLEAVEYGTELTVEGATTTEEGYELKELQVNGAKLEGKTFKVTANTTVTAVFGKKTFPVTASVKDDKGGEVKIEGTPDLTAVEYGTTLTVVVTPDEANGYKLKAVTVNGTPLAEGVMTFVVKEAKTVEAEFELKTFAVAKELKGITKGEITITGAANLEAVEYGTELTVAATTTEEGYELKEIQLNGKKLEGNKFVVKEDTKVTALFEKETPVEDAQFANVNVAPNPFTTQLLVRSNGMTGAYALLNAQGTVLRSGSLESGEVSIETTDLSAGLYLLRLTSESRATKTYRIVKQ